MNILGGTLVAVGVNEMQCTDLCLGKTTYFKSKSEKLIYNNIEVHTSRDSTECRLEST